MSPRFEEDGEMRIVRSHVAVDRNQRRAFGSPDTVPHIRWRCRQTFRNLAHSWPWPPGILTLLDKAKNRVSHVCHVIGTHRLCTSSPLTPPPAPAGGCTPAPPSP